MEEKNIVKGLLKECLDFAVASREGFEETVSWTHQLEELYRWGIENIDRMDLEEFFKEFAERGKKLIPTSWFEDLRKLAKIVVKSMVSI